MILPTMHKLAKSMIPCGIVDWGRRRIARRAQTDRQTELYRCIVRPNSTVFDIGANVGNRVTAFLNCGASVVAIEPQPNCVRILQRSYRRRITVVQAAVGPQAGRLLLHVGSRTGTTATLSPDFMANADRTKRFSDHEWTGTMEVDVITLDSLITKHGIPSFIKIDVEGFEYEVLHGLSQPVDTLSFEWTSDMPDAAIRCIDYLSSLGMNHFQLSFGESMLWAHNTSQSAATMKQIVALLGEEMRCFGDIYASRNPLTRRSL